MPNQKIIPNYSKVKVHTTLPAAVKHKTKLISETQP